MTIQEFATLKDFARIFARTEDDADELFLLASLEGVGLGSKCVLPLLINHMRLCSKSISERSLLALDEAGKSRLDAFNKGNRYLSDQIADDSTLEKVIASDPTSPFDDYISTEFISSLRKHERNVLSELMAGYSAGELCKDLRISSKRFKSD